MGASAKRNSEQRNARRVFIPHLQFFSANSSRRFHCASQPAHRTSEPAPDSQKWLSHSYDCLHRPNTRRSFFGAILQQILQLTHKFLDVLEVHVDGSESHVGDFVEFFQAVHNHFADFGGGELALGGLVHHAFDFVDDGFEFGRWHRPLFAGFQQALENFLALEAFAAAVLLDDHVGNFVDALIGGEAAAAFEAFAAAANGVAGAAFARINHLVVHVRTERALHSGESPWRIFVPALLSAISWSTISSSCLAISRSSPSDQP